MGGSFLLDSPVDLEEMARRLELARERAGLTVSQLSFRSEVDVTLLRKYLAGRTEPGATRLARIAKALNVSADWLLQTTDDPAVTEPWDGKTERRANPPISGGAPTGGLPVPKPPARKRRRTA
jgi:transcriptional regulator with XRE-family HTH domain